MFINCTPHPINVLDAEGVQHTIPASGTVARCAAVRTEEPAQGGFRVVRQSFGAVEGLPAPVPGTTYIVSALVLSALGGSRPDVVAPDTGPDAIREGGQIKAVRGFVV